MKTLGYLARPSVRDATIAGALAIVFLMTGSCAPPGVADAMAGAPFDLDISLRALAQGWYPTRRTLPVTIVDIDEATQARWGHPATTPRADLARLIGTVAAAHPRAVVVDIDLSYGPDARIDAGRLAFRRFLERYNQSAPLIFPKRIAQDVLQQTAPVASDLDDVIGVRPKLIWADASFSTSGGVVRDWDEWTDFCVSEVAGKLPAVAMVAVARKDSVAPAATDAPRQPCSTSGATIPPTSHRLLLGPRMTGPTRVPTPKTQAISAALLLEPNVARNDAALFTDRIVLIGATHQDAGDSWLTPRGYIPGVELLANIIQYAPVTLGASVVSAAQFRLVTVFVFLALALGTWWLNGVATAAGVIVGMLVFTSIALGVFEWFWFFDAVASALTLIVGYEAIRALIAFGLRVREEMHRLKASSRVAEAPEPRRAWVVFTRLLRAIGRSCLRKPEPIEGAT